MPLLLLANSASVTRTFVPTAASSDGAPVCALSVIDAVANVATGLLAYVPGGQWSAKWEASTFRASRNDNDTITGPVTVTWTLVRLEATEKDVTLVDSEGGTSTVTSGAARTTATHTTTITAPGAGWATLNELHDVVVSLTAGGGDSSKIAVRTAQLTVASISTTATGTPVVTVVHPPAQIARDVAPRVQWAFDHPSGLDQGEYHVRVFAGAPSPAPESDPKPLYDSGAVTSAWAEHLIVDELDWTAGLRVYVRARAAGGTWATWVYRTVTSEPDRKSVV